MKPLLVGDKGTPLAAHVVPTARRAIPHPSPNLEACYRIYEGAISEIDRKHRSCTAARRVLQDGLDNADRAADWAAKAWALRDSFDGLMSAIATQQGAAK